LTVQLERIPLRLAIAEVTKQAGVQIILEDGAGNEPVTASFHALPLDEGIRRLLGPHSYAVIYAAAGTPAGPPDRPSLSHPRPRPTKEDHLDPVLPEGERLRLEELRQEAWTAEDPTERGRALAALTRRVDDREALALLTAALGDAEAQVRGKAVELVADRRDPEAVELLTRALADPDEQVRARAQELLEEIAARQQP
jgi:hypothetical protein